MSTHGVRPFVITVALLAVVVPSPQAPVSAHTAKWLSGCWERRSGPRLVQEQWMAPRGGLMLGVSRTTRNDTLIEFELLRLYEQQGRLVYAAMPSRQPPASFTSVTVSDTLLVFENPQHDFPQRIIYRRRGADSVVARIEGTTGGQARGVDFPYARAQCPGAG